MKHYHEINFKGLYNQFIIFYETLKRTFKDVIIILKKEHNITTAVFKVANY